MKHTIECGAMPLRKIIITADDYGRQVAEDVRIERALSDGVVSNISVMANLVDHERLRQLHSLVGECSVGIHINLTEGRPVSQPGTIATLVDGDGRFYSCRDFLFRLAKARIRFSHITTEIAAQIALFREWYGAPSHMDSHKHILQFPEVLEAGLHCAARADIRRMRTTSRVFVDSEGEVGTWLSEARHYARMPAALIARPLKTWANWKITRSGLSRPDRLISPEPPITSGSVEEAARSWERVLCGLPPGTFEANFHPGYEDRDFRLLTSSRFKEVLAAAQFVVSGYFSL